MDKFLFLLPYFIAITISLGVLVYTWRFRNVRGAKAYAWYVAGQFFWGVGYICELVSQTLNGKVFWDQSQWIAGLLITIAFPVFAVQYTETKIRRSRLLFGLSLLVPLLFLGLLLTDSLHHLLYPNPYLDHSVIFSDLKYDFTWVVFAIAIYSYLTILTGLGILLRRMIKPHLFYRRQIATIAVGFFIPIFFTMLTTLGVKFMPFRDISPFTFAAGNLIVAWGLFRFHLFDIIPIARDLIIENMEDLVIVLDIQNRIVDINTSALAAINQKPREVIGHPIETVMTKWPDLLKKFELPENVKTEITIYAGGRPYQYEVKSTLLYDKRGRFLGRFFVSRDITEHTILKNQLQSLNEELEDRVAMRTEELRQSAERYRAVVEHQTEFIVRWKPDRTRTFVNEAYCRYFGLTHEEAMTVDFITLIVEEDRYLVQESITLLEAGIVDTSTEIHRVIKADGSIGWNEWVDTAIRDENGKIMEFQSVGRDITERIQAQETLHLQGAALEVAANGIVITDRDGIIQWANPAFTILTGYLIEEAIGKNPRELVYSGKQDRAFYKDLWETILAGQVWRGELINRRKDGTLYNEEMTLTPVQDKNGRVIRFIAIKQDISERKLVEQALRESEQKHRLLFEAANDSIFIMKKDRFIDCNSKTLEMFGCQRDQILGKSPVDFSPDRQPDGQISEKKAYEKIEAVLNGESQFFEWKHCRLNKTLFDAEVSLNPLVIDGETYIQAIVRDVTERKRAEETILKQLAFEETLTAILTSFATCPHDEIDARIQKALQKLASFMEIERAYMIIIDPEQSKTWSITHEWNIPQAPPFLLVRKKIPLGTFPWAENQILFGNVTRINTLDDYPAEASAIHKQHHEEGTKSVLNVPVRGSEEQISGCIGVHTYTHSKIWTDDDITHLRIIGDAIANILERKHAEEMLLTAYDTTLEGWAKALELRDKETEDHSRRVTELTMVLARALGIQGDELVHIRRGTILHDIGKMAIPDDILRKPGKLTLEERKIMEQHPVHSHHLLSSIPFLEKAMVIPYCHHERWDGSGYPRGLKGEEIPLAARIFAVVDVWDAVQSDRPYNQAWSRDEAIDLIKNSSGSHFDPGIVDVFLELVERDKI